MNISKQFPVCYQVLSTTHTYINNTSVDMSYIFEIKYFKRLGCLFHSLPLIYYIIPFSETITINTSFSWILFIPQLCIISILYRQAYLVPAPKSHVEFSWSHSPDQHTAEYLRLLSETKENSQSLSLTMSLSA